MGIEQSIAQANLNNLFETTSKQFGPLDPFFKPELVAVIGDSPKFGNTGKKVLWNLVSSSFGGTVFPISQTCTNVMGITTYPSLEALLQPVDLAILACPLTKVPGIMKQCSKAGAKGVLIIEDEMPYTEPAEYQQLIQQIREQTRQSNMRVIGPNSIGVLRPVTGLNASIAKQAPLPGKVAFITQSASLCPSVLDWSIEKNIGFSAFISIGSMLDVNLADLISYFGDDPYTKSIIIYMEKIANPRAFISAAREVSLTKPIIVLKANHSQKSSASSSRPKQIIVDEDDIIDAVLRRCGVLRVNTIDELFYMSEVLSMQPRPNGPCLTILTNAGGPGVLATDTLVRGGGELAIINQECREAFDKVLPPHWSHNNPVDIIGDAGPERYSKAIEIAINNPNSDGLLVILTPQTMTQPTAIAQELSQAVTKFTKPVLACWMGGDSVAEADKILNRAGVPDFPYPDTAAQVFNYMWRYKYNLDALYETPVMPAFAEMETSEFCYVKKLIEDVRTANRTELNELEVKEILQAYDIPLVQTLFAADEEEAVRTASKIGYPVVLKMAGSRQVRNAIAGAVQLNLTNDLEVRQAYRTVKDIIKAQGRNSGFDGVTIQPMQKPGGYEVVIASRLDSKFGPILIFGSGGQPGEVFQDYKLGLPPLNSTLAHRLMEQTQVYSAFKGVRGQKPVNLEALELILAQFSRLVVEQRMIKEIELNPVYVSAESIVVLEAQILLHDPGINEACLPALIIRPYPVQYVKDWQLKKGPPVTIRPIRPEDEPLMVKFHQSLSDQSVYLRYLHMMGVDQRTAHDYLRRMCFIDYEWEMALVAVYDNPKIGQPEILGVGRLIRQHDKNQAEFALLVEDRYQNCGLGTELAQRIIQLATDEGLELIVGTIHPENRPMFHICQKLGFESEYKIEDQLIEVALKVPSSTKEKCDVAVS
ncbi:MAG TPA: bifunctional acetate--CoA ligase family protein/GNAT family N-acetyltransferase [Chloroflexia bacterium]|nr:bifunctional acetate--CoA ligase family protein/GNAT family N-acetyltransferase [Chloroflexia bacterium]